MKTHSRKVILGMSGGVDSSVAAAVLKQRGYEVIGVTLALLPPKCDSPRADACCGVQAVEDARAVCAQLDIPFYCINRADKFAVEIIDYFCAEYNCGRTPNPCVVCNHRIKFPELLKKADEVGAEYIATGHFARITASDGRYSLLQGVDRSKEQSYFLFGLNQSTLSRIIFPLGEMRKEEVRRLAERLELKVHNKPESQEICFVPDNRYPEFLRQWAPQDIVPGDILDKQGRKIGCHKGIQFYTIGQRRGAGVALGKPLYVIDIDAETNTIVMGDNEDLLKKRMRVGNLMWIEQITDQHQLKATVKVRYNHPEAPATIVLAKDNSAEIIFDKPERAITPGQAAVFYRDEVVLGGGWIEKCG